MYIKRFEKYGDKDVRESKFYVVVFDQAHEIMDTTAKGIRFYHLMRNLAESPDEFKLPNIYDIDIVELIQTSFKTEVEANKFMETILEEIEEFSSDDSDYKESVKFIRGELEVKEFTLMIKETGELFSLS